MSEDDKGKRVGRGEALFRGCLRPSPRHGIKCVQRTGPLQDQSCVSGLPWRTIITGRPLGVSYSLVKSMPSDW